MAAWLRWEPALRFEAGSFAVSELSRLRPSAKFNDPDAHGVCSTVAHSRAHGTSAVIAGAGTKAGMPIT
jgi:hypothetical protein